MVPDFLHPAKAQVRARAYRAFFSWLRVTELAGRPTFGGEAASGWILITLSVKIECLIFE